MNISTTAIEAPSRLPLGFTVIPDAATFEALSIVATILVINSRVLKFLIDLTPAPGAEPIVHFLNGNYQENGDISSAAEYHYELAKHELNLDMTVRVFQSGDVIYPAQSAFRSWDPPYLFSRQQFCAHVMDENEVSEVKRKGKPKTVACPIRGVYASLWNKRAIEERCFTRVDHTTAAMALLIVPVYDLEDEVGANTVVVTRILNTENVMGTLFQRGKVTT